MLNQLCSSKQHSLEVISEMPPLTVFSKVREAPAQAHYSLIYK